MLHLISSRFCRKLSSYNEATLAFALLKDPVREVISFHANLWQTQDGSKKKWPQKWIQRQNPKWVLDLFDRSFYTILTGHAKKQSARQFCCISIERITDKTFMFYQTNTFDMGKWIGYSWQIQSHHQIIPSGSSVETLHNVFSEQHHAKACISHKSFQFSYPWKSRTRRLVLGLWNTCSRDSTGGSFVDRCIQCLSQPEPKTILCYL